jgi:hypothetical protein
MRIYATNIVADLPTRRGDARLSRLGRQSGVGFVAAIVAPHQNAGTTRCQGPWKISASSIPVRAAFFWEDLPSWHSASHLRTFVKTITRFAPCIVLAAVQQKRTLMQRA